MAGREPRISSEDKTSWRDCYAIALSASFIRFLLLINSQLPQDIQITPRGAIYLETEKGDKKIIQVMFSESVKESYQTTGRISPQVDICKWVSPSDVLLFYARPQTGRDVGQVTTALLNHLKKNCGLLIKLDGIGRALRVIKDLVAGNKLRFF